MILYHYTSGQGLKGIIESKQLHCTNINFLNDPTENNYSKYVLNEVLKENKKCKTIYNKLFDEIYKDFFVDDDRIYILSFCKFKDSLSMWKHYGKGNGYCIGIEFDNILNKYPSKLGFEISEVPIVYQKEEQKKIISKFILSFANTLNKLDSGHNLKNNNEHARKSALQKDFNLGLISCLDKMKHSAYEDENEIRILIKIDDYYDPNYIKYRLSNTGVFIEYLSLDIDIENDIASILCHPQSTDINLLGVKSFLKNSKLYDIKVCRSEIPFREL